MVRILGAFMLTAALTAVGISKALECRRRLSSIRNTVLMLEMINNELCTSRTPIIKIFERLQKTARGDVKRFSDELVCSMTKLGEQDFCSLWNGAVSQVYTYLPDDCLSELESLGAVLGKYDADMQSEAIERCKTAFCNKLDELSPQNDKLQKMYIGLYGGAGLIAAVMLI